MPARRAASISDVARRAGVSVGTVSNVLNRPGVVSPARRRTVAQAIRELGYVRNDAARQLKAGLSQTVGGIVLDSSNPFYADLLEGASSIGEELGLAVVVGSSANRTDREELYLTLFEEQRVRGILLATRGESAEPIAAVRDRGTPIILVDDPSEGAYCSVAADDRAGGRLAVRHLLQTGRRRIAVIAADLALHQVADRWAGAQRESAELPDATIERVEAGALSVLAGRAAAERILERPEAEWPDAIFCVNDLLAVGAMQALSFGRENLVPGRIALIGYDDISFARSTVVPLSSVAQPADLIGRTALRLLEEEIAEGDEHRHRHVTFQPELIARESTAPPA